MRDIPVKNRELLGRLSPYVDLLNRDREKFQRIFHLSCSQELRNRSYWVGDRHLREIRDQLNNHEGFPEIVCGYDLKIREDHVFFSQEAQPVEKMELMTELSALNRDLIEWVAAANYALVAYYPPGGFISWHNNANAAAYNIIFTWSENGNGCFKYIDPETKELVVMQDKAGWQCKAGYFGRHNEPEKLLYHAAETDDWRLTISFMFNQGKMSEEFREDILEEIATEE
jgi:hypothetical protein